ncbi:MAG: hypothetical protein KIT32_12290 [Rhodocyclaceae bacterium]|nr:hypothetical protein [Rhodocyclaceae bacterium]
MNPQWRQMMQGAYTIPPNPVPRYNFGASSAPQAASPEQNAPQATPSPSQGIPWGYKFDPKSGGFVLDYSQIMPATDVGNENWPKLQALMQAGGMPLPVDTLRAGAPMMGGYFNSGR